MNNKVKSFTLSELLVVLIITAVVVGIAFSVIQLVQKEISIIKKNYEKSTTLSLFEQRFWQDFNQYNLIKFHNNSNSITFATALDSIEYQFKNEFILRNADTIKLKLKIVKAYYSNKLVNEGEIDAIDINASTELPNHKFFIFKKNDLTKSMNQENGFSIK